MKILNKIFLLKHLLIPREKVLLVDNEFFFVESINVEKNLCSIRTLKQIVMLQIESICPFNLDDVLYGYFFDKNKRKLIIFIAYKDRVSATYGRLSNYNYILPQFFCNLLKDKCFDVEKVNIIDNFINFINDDKVLSLKVTDRKVYCANLVPDKKKFKNLCNVFALNTLRFASLFCLLLLFIQVVPLTVVCMKNKELSTLSKMVDDDAVSEVISQDKFLNEMKRFYRDDDFCLSGLNFINTVRTDDIVFTDVHAHSTSRALKIKGYADSVSSIESFQNNVKNLIGIKLSLASHIRSKDHKASFDLEVQFE